MHTKPRRRSGRRKPHGWRTVAVLLTSILALVGLAGWAGLSAESAAPISSGPLALPGLPDRAAVPDLVSTAPARPNLVAQAGAFVVSASVAGRSQILAFVPGDPQIRQLTDGDWDNRDPAVSPNLDLLAFSSRRDGNWELYLLNLLTGELRRLTGTPGFEGNPTWSPDGLWLAYEAHYGNDFNIWVLPIDGSQSPVQLTDHPAADLAPAWDPGGRRIAFVSDRDGSADIFLADLDKPVDRFSNLTHTAELAEADPTFSPDGSRIAFSVQQDGIYGIQSLPLDQPEAAAVWIGQGQHPAWVAEGHALSAILRTPFTSHVVTYPIEGALGELGGSLEGRISQLHWSPIPLAGFNFPIQAPTGLPFELVWDQPRAEGSRVALVPLEGVSPPGVSLSDAADEAFAALRARVAREAGWDFLSQLQNAFVGINDPLPPGYAYNDWLYTGRGFAISRAAFQAGWVAVVREDFGLQTFWRVLVRTAAQDGSQGEPLRWRPWDFDSRYAGDPAAYDRGGTEQQNPPAGYYFDFTALAADYGFDRLPALSNWRSFYPGARFEEFALRESLDWVTAMRELYPDSAIATPTPYQTPTPTPTNTPRPTPTPWWWRWRTPTPTPSSTPTVQP